MKCAESAFGVVCGRRMNGVAPFVPVVAVALLGAFPAAQMLVVPLCLLLPLPFPHFWRGIPGNWTFFTRRLDWKMIGIGIPLGFAGVMLFQFFLAAVAWGFGLEMTEQPLVEYIRAMSGRRLIFFGFLLAVWSPLLEELAFRHWLFGGMASRMNWKVAAVGAALVFALLHFSPWQLPGLFFLGLFWQYVYLKTGNLWNAVILHSANNLLTLLLTFAVNG